jgi:hypothetical protein
MDELMEQLHAMIPPEGKYRRLQLHNNFADANFCKECVEDTQRLIVRLALGEKPTALELLGLEILFNTAGQGWREWLKND